ncbi:MAG: glutamine amidotransferase [Lentisphaeria bacterium]|nr:glutamine amidotransferase [Lentisphaeria bacterium]
MNWMTTIFGIKQLIWARPAHPLMIPGALAAVVILSLFLYRQSRGVPSRVRAGLLVARMVVLSLVVLALFEPHVVVERTRRIKRRLPVLIDVSKSMSIKDQRKRPADVVEAAVALGLLPQSATGDVNRAALELDSKQRETIAAASRVDLAGSMLSTSGRPVLTALERDLDIAYYVFGTNLRLLGEGETMATDALTGLLAEETGTSIADSLKAVASSNRDAPLAGIVLLSDGLDTSSRNAKAALHDLGIQGIPVFPVPVGLVDPDDVSIRNVVMQDVAFSGDKVPVRVQIRSKGYEKRMASMTVRLNGRNVARRAIQLAGGLQFEEIFFNVDTHEKGAAQAEIAIEPFADEATAENNVVERSVRIVNEKINVLCIEGSARWEYRYLRAMLKRDPRVNATFIATRADPGIARNSSEYIARFPERREEAFKYDLVILGDVDAAFFSGDELLRLEELIRERGGSLLMLCGSRFSPASYSGTPVETMLPVTFEPDGEWEDVDDAVYPVLTPEGRSSLVMTLEHDREENDTVWSRVAPLDRVPPLLEARPGATVLATLSNSGSRIDPYPLVAWQRYGTGKCMMIGTDRMWLLRFKTGDKYHWRVWSQCIQFLTLSRLMGEHKRIRLETDRATYAVDGQVQLYAHLLDDRFEPIMQSGFDVTVTALASPGAVPQRLTLRPDAGTAGLYQGYFSPTRPGSYRVEANSTDRSIANITEFQVTDIQPEMAGTDMQIERLRRIAELSGGTCLNLTRMDELPNLLNLNPRTIPYTTQVALWDNAWLLILLAALMGTEWIVRRKYDLP